jgi:PadR family transcriptional regulator, regulatory protein PadR
MKRTTLGEFEELVLFTIVALMSGAYSVAVCDELEKHTGRKVRPGVMPYAPGDNSWGGNETSR